ncbi:MAG: hypothetical protein E7166_01875 [Firmicutes bacterium]|nr:hypothetical protein [Bacillota bacterium]
MENENLDMVQKSNTKNIIAIIAIIVIFLGLLFVTFSYFNSPKKTFVDGINKVYKVLLDNASNKKVNKILNNDIVGLDGETRINLSGSIVDDTLKLFDNTVIKYNYIEDKKNKNASLDLDSSIDNETLVNIYGLIKDNKAYFKLENIINKYYHVEYIFKELLAVDNAEDSKYVIDILRDSIIKKLDSDYFSSDNVSLKINGKDEKVKKMSFKFTDKYIIDVSSEFAKKVKNDDKAIKILVDYNNLTKEEIIEKLDNVIKSAEKVTTSNQDFVFNIYVKDYINSVKYELVIDNVSISYSNYKDVKEFSVLEEETEYLDIKIENNKNISGILFGMIPIKGTYENNKLDLSFNYMNIKCNLVINNEENYKEDSIDSNINIKLNINETGNEYLDLQINTKNSISKYDKINEVNIQSSTAIEEMKEEDKNTIMNKLMETKLFKQISTIYEQNKIESSGLKVSGIEEEISF